MLGAQQYITTYAFFRFEDGTLPFLSILALRHGFDTLKRLNLDMNAISKHSFSLAQYVYKNLATLHHSNGKPVVIFYHDSTFNDINLQGSTVNFNLLRDNGEYVGNTEVSKRNFTHTYRMYKSLTVFQP